jgi:hypothetical protein
MAIKKAKKAAPKKAAAAKKKVAKKTTVAKNLRVFNERNALDECRELSAAALTSHCPVASSISISLARCSNLAAAAVSRVRVSLSCTPRASRFARSANWRSLMGSVSTSRATCDAPGDRHGQGIKIDDAIHAEALSSVDRKVGWLIGGLPFKLNLDGFYDLFF